MTATVAPRPTAEARIKAATWFAERGFGVFSVWSADADGTCRCPRRAACGSPGKHPIGRQGFLEHTRVFHFHNAGAEDVYLSSADWMDRNFLRRIELCFPVLDAALKRRVLREGLHPYLDDNCQAWVMNQDGSYERTKPRRGRRRSAQEELLFTLATPS